MNTFFSAKIGKRVRQIRKDVARKLFNAGKDIYFQSSNMPFGSMWQSPMKAQKNGWSFAGYSFDQICDSFEVYNCDSERGKYIHFFVEE